MLKRIDLTRDYHKHKAEYMAAIEAVCEETAFSGGSFADKFDKEFADYCHVKYATGVNNGTTALQAAMIALGVGPGDEVIVPANTYIATAWGVTHAGATPVFVDCTADTWEIDPSKIEEKITDKTKGIIGVHLYGQPFDFAGVKAIADKHGLFVVEDCAQAHGAEFEGKRVGGLGDIGCFSFYPGKNLYAFGEGGSCTSNNEEYIDTINVLKNQGCRVRYYHERIGYNMRLEGVQGAVLSVSLKYLDEWTARRREIGKRYMAEIKNDKFVLQAHPENTDPVFHLFEVQVPDPDAFLAYMAKNDVECNRHYPVPCHLQKAYADLGYKEGDCPNAERLAAHCATLPLFPEMTDEEVALVIKLCNEY
ncbi:DegT/DnrJ/EryC1/StrS family aminotransferase [Butyrivibrio sp. AE2032]|uniref:DegT/DnrJ/EryC1/StrS family aminotransferase n=1 Tax=Butyrivibrio sp. AE2032 TaxID=1458463 RepID=UPI0005571E85|nr:DegT/DnrJ/EryC1/StrS family aminotransferase [Butyrivibrio sp. AE2032]